MTPRPWTVRTAPVSVGTTPRRARCAPYNHSVPYHVIVTIWTYRPYDRYYRRASRVHGTYDARWEYALDKDESWIRENIVIPLQFRRRVTIAGKTFQLDDVKRIQITWTAKTAGQEVISSRPMPPPRSGLSGLFGKQLPGPVPHERECQIIAHNASDVTADFITGMPGIVAAWPAKRGGAVPQAETRAAGDQRGEPGEDTVTGTNRKAVMVIYGHDQEANKALFGWLRAIELQPREWGQLVQLCGEASPFTGNVLPQALASVQAVIALFTPDEYVSSAARAGSANPARLQARPNVLIETGMAFVTHPDRTILVTLGPQELPSDLAGRDCIRLNGTAAPLKELADRLKAAGCDVELAGVDWLDPQRFPSRNAPGPPGRRLPAADPNS